MSLLDHPDAQALLKDAILTPEAVRGCRDRLRRFLSRYLPHFYRKEQRDHAALVIRGLLSDLQRKTAEPIADCAGVEHKNIQFFIGSGQWDDDAILMELRRHVRRVLGDSEAVLVLDPSAFPKKGTESCGVTPPVDFIRNKDFATVSVAACGSEHEDCVIHKPLPWPNPRLRLWCSVRHLSQCGSVSRRRGHARH